MDAFDEANALAYLKRHYPHLYSFEMNIRKVVEETGFGDASVTCIVRHGKVFSWDSTFWVKHLSTENSSRQKEAGGSEENPQSID
jgi:hypothetical protein